MRIVAIERTGSQENTGAETKLETEECVFNSLIKIKTYFPNSKHQQGSASLPNT